MCFSFLQAEKQGQRKSHKSYAPKICEQRKMSYLRTGMKITPKNNKITFYNKIANMKKIMYLASALLILSCSKTADKNTMIIEGNIEGLKKGTIFLQQYNGEKLINLDSVQAKGNGKFTFKRHLESPEIFFIYLDLGKKEGTDFGDRLLFFGEPKKITITSKHDMFDIHAKIEGSESQKLLEEYNRNIRKFSNRNLELFEQQINAIKAQQQAKVDSINSLSEKNTIRRYLYALNFAITHPDSYVSPYIAVTDTPDANIKYLDSIYKVLTPEVAGSKYGNQLKNHIEAVKTEMQKQQNQ